jgi:hypothetical protein
MGEFGKFALRTLRILDLMYYKMPPFSFYFIQTGSQPNIPQTSTSGTHKHRQHYSHMPNKRGKQAEKVITALSTKDDPLKMVKQL